MIFHYIHLQENGFVDSGDYQYEDITLERVSIWNLRNLCLVRDLRYNATESFELLARVPAWSLRLFETCFKYFVLLLAFGQGVV